ncbi:retinitis pigmentosa 9 protein isoform X1 [Chiloscyllium plagiosum]|uniref:retinitis pigmentosa 9 protein isoform X1 n=1 Tax=Chiloscyllium plagiosum TaxID=36176 RepID=UPI001CB7AFDD|nr:retinitis pigmentosa 9 protein isoform X1 [Chiloscyllium plagiosum]
MAEGSRTSGHERRHKRHAAEEREPEKKKKKRLHQEVKKIKHVETFYEKPPPGMIKENDDKPEDCIPDLPGNEEARDFLAHAPTKGLWMPLGKEVKVMQCWRCKNFGHRTGDRECPYFISGNQKLEQFRVELTIYNEAYDLDLQLANLSRHSEKMKRMTGQRLLLQAHEDPMYDLIRENKRCEKETRIQQLKQMLEDTTSDSNSSSSSDSIDRHRKKKKRKEKKRKKEKKKKKKHKSRKLSHSSD